jgi:hypothetical protein
MTMPFLPKVLRSASIALFVPLTLVLVACNPTAQAPPPDLTQGPVENPLPPPPSNTPSPASRSATVPQLQAANAPVSSSQIEAPSVISDEQPIVIPPPAAAQGNRPALVSDPSFSLPAATGCTGAVQRFQALVDNDLKTGHTTKDVRNEISAELTSLRGRCANGEDTSEDVVLLRQRFGYPSI